MAPNKTWWFYLLFPFDFGHRSGAIQKDLPNPAWKVKGGILGSTYQAVIDRLYYVNKQGSTDGGCLSSLSCAVMRLS